MKDNPSANVMLVTGESFPEVLVLRTTRGTSDKRSVEIPQNSRTLLTGIVSDNRFLVRHGNDNYAVSPADLAFLAESNGGNEEELLEQAQQNILTQLEQPCSIIGRHPSQYVGWQVRIRNTRSSLAFLPEHSGAARQRVPVALGK